MTNRDILRQQREARAQQAQADTSAEDVMLGLSADAFARIELLESHLRSVIEIARTWRPEYATKMDRDTLDIAAAALPPLGSNLAPRQPHVAQPPADRQALAGQVAPAVQQAKEGQ